MRRSAPLLVLSLALLVPVLAGFLAAEPGMVGDVDVGEAGARLSIDLRGHVRAGGVYDPGDRPSVLISPDGHWRAVLHLPGMSGNTGTVEIGRHDPDGPLRTVERHLFAGTARAIWSPDSRWLAMTVWVPHIVSAVAVSTDGRRKVLAAPFCGDSSSDLAWEPHGDRIALGVPSPGASCTNGIDLRLVSMGSGDRRVIAKGIAGAPAWSPDGRWIATSGGEVMRPDGTGRRTLAGGFSAWAPRGHLLALMNAQEMLMLGQAPGRVRVVDAHLQTALPPSFSPDGRLVAYARWDAIVVRRVADRRVVAEVPVKMVNVQHLTWAADGNSLLADAQEFRQSD
jgi:hypothetical protein